jgi:hypothetical protein
MSSLSPTARARASLLHTGRSPTASPQAPMDGLVVVVAASPAQTVAAQGVAQAVRILPSARALQQQSHRRGSMTQAWGHSGPA